MFLPPLDVGFAQRHKRPFAFSRHDFPSSLFSAACLLFSGNDPKVFSIALGSVMVFSTMKLISRNNLSTISRLSSPVKSICPSCAPPSLPTIRTVSSDIITACGKPFLLKFPMARFKLDSFSPSDSQSFLAVIRSKAAAALGEEAEISRASL